MLNVCQRCGATVGPRRRYCSRACYHAGRSQDAPSKATARKRAARAQPHMVACERCGRTHGLERHHPDITADATWVEVLCSDCHARADRKLGKRGHGYNKPRRPRERPRRLQSYGQGPAIVSVRDARDAPQDSLLLYAPSAEMLARMAETHADRVLSVIGPLDDAMAAMIESTAAQTGRRTAVIK